MRSYKGTTPLDWWAKYRLVQRGVTPIVHQWDNPVQEDDEMAQVGGNGCHTPEGHLLGLAAVR